MPRDPRTTGEPDLIKKTDKIVAECSGDTAGTLVLTNEVSMTGGQVRELVIRDPNLYLPLLP
jgi:hypothetical protein